MKTLFVVFLLVVTLTIFGYSQPGIEIGAKITRHLHAEIFTFPQSTFTDDVINELYWGVSGEFLLLFTRDLSLRLEIFEFRIFDLGGTGANIFSNLGADIIYSLPLKWKLKPLIYGGGAYEGYFDKPTTDYRGFCPAYEIHLGPGLIYTFNKTTKLFLESEMYTKYQTLNRRMPLEDIIFSAGSTMLGIQRINLGVRYKL